MLTATWYIVAGAALVAMGIVGVGVCPTALRRILALNIMGSGVFLLLVAPADRLAGRAPDPVPHAMVLTGIVVAVSATALALALTRRLAALDDGPSRDADPSDGAGRSNGGRADEAGRGDGRGRSDDRHG
ncbi:MAG: cation:proton antiporter subunit C [Vicinamibacterales bacterium]